jgi:uncharacterized paraquat-inducible protein A
MPDFLIENLQGMCSSIYAHEGGVSCAETVRKVNEYCAVCLAAKRLKQRDKLETALSDLLAVIAADNLIPESVSYMRQAREALEAK